MSAIADGGVALKRWLFDRALPLWAQEGVDPGSGAFQETIGLDGRATASPRRARVQARQVYVYAAAGRLGWDGPWRPVMERGLDAFLARYRRGYGLVRTRVGADGAPADETATLYDQAFALFALASAASALEPDAVETDALETDALALLDAVEASFRLPGGGLREEDAARPFQSNPHMHLFEAALAWADQGRSALWDALADEIAALALSRFIDPRSGALREFFDADWRPAAGADGRIVEPGHQFEWAWLLDRWGERRGRGDARAAARRLYRIGMDHGLDPARGVAINQLDDSLQPLDRTARLWPQTERLKAALRLAEPPTREGEVADAIAGLRRYLDDAPSGLWRDRLLQDDTFVGEPAPASSFYHIVCAIEDLLRQS